LIQKPKPKDPEPVEVPPAATQPLNGPAPLVEGGP